MKLSIAIMVGSRRARGQRALDCAAASAVGCSAEILVLELVAGQLPLRVPDHLPVTVLQLGGSTIGVARAAAARAARGQLVAYVEDHCYAEPGWASVLCARADEGWSAVGYGFRNANPGTAASRAMALMEYGDWVVPSPRSAHPTAMLAGNNIAYSREALLGLERQADELLDSDWILQRVLSAGGGRLLFEPDAIAAHEHFERLADGLAILAMYGTLSTQRRARAERWTYSRRMLHVVLALPATPAVRIVRLLRRRPDLAGRVAQSLPLMLPPLVACAWGEVRGAARPNDPAPARRFAALEMELYRTVS